MRKEKTSNPRPSPAGSAYFVYILRCRDKSLYTGITTDVARRFAEHQRGSASRYTSAKQAVKIMYSEKQPTRSAALKREAEIKTWPRAKKLNLIKSRDEAGRTTPGSLDRSLQAADLRK